MSIDDRKQSKIVWKDFNVSMEWLTKTLNCLRTNGVGGGGGGGGVPYRTSFHIVFPGQLENVLSKAFQISHYPQLIISAW